MLFAVTTITAQTASKELLTKPRVDGKMRVHRPNKSNKNALKTTTPLRSITSEKAEEKGSNSKSKSAIKHAASDYDIITERPEGEMRTYTRTGQHFYRNSDITLLNGEVGGLINIVFANDGEHVYMQGPVTGLDSDRWVKGTISGNTISIPMGQYLHYYPEYDACTVLRFVYTLEEEDGEILNFWPDKETTEAKFIISDDGNITLQDSSQEHILALVWSDNELDWSGYGDYETVYIPAKGQSLPYEKTFASADSFMDMTVIDANNDAKTWTHYESVAKYEYSYYSKADDWLITPGINLKAGETYYFATDIRESSETYGPEKFEVKMGMAPDVNDMTTEVIPAQLLTSAQFSVISNDNITVSQDGTYYFGIHAISDSYRDCIFVRSITVDKKATGNAPTSVLNLMGEADPSGALKATLTFDAPTKTVSGTALNAQPMKARIYRDGDFIDEIDMVSGQKNVTYTDENVPYYGYFNYAVSASINDERGEKSEIEVYVGTDAPGPVPSVTITETDNGQKIEWEDVPETGILVGGPVNLADITYDIYDTYITGEGDCYLNNVINEAPVDGNVWMHEPYAKANEGQQGLVRYAVVPISAVTGKDWYVFTMGEILEGKPDDIPYHESITGHKLSHFLTWDGTLEGVFLYYSTESSDGDGEAMKMEADFSNSIGTLETGKIALNNAAKPYLIYDVFSNKTNNTINLYGIAPNGVKELLETYNPTTTYSKHKVDLSQFSDKRWVRFFFETNYASASHVTFDNINVIDLRENDLQLTFEAPSEIIAGQKAPLDITVSNHGINPASGYTLRVLANDKVIYNETVTEPLDFYASKAFDVYYKPSIYAESEEVVLTAELTYDGDEYTDDNVLTSSIMIKEPVASMAEGLEYTYDNGIITLNWNGPSALSQEITDDFEDFEPWAIDGLGDWITVNRDESYTMPIYSGMPIAHDGEKIAFTVWNYDGTNILEGNNNSKRFLAGLPGKTADGKYAPVDDWLISPELSGQAQTISFYVWGRNYYYEKYNVLYSTTDTNIESFTAVNSSPLTANSYEWKKVSFDLPEGAKYFAIQRKQTSGGDTWVLGIDDITYYIPGDAPAEYNIYVNRMKAVTVPASQLSYVLEHMSYNTHEIGVTAVYSDGRESRPVVVNIPVYETSPLSIPEDGEVVSMYLKGTDFVMESPIEQEVTAIFHEDKVYLQGLRRTDAQQWAVGTIADGKVYFPGYYSMGSKNGTSIFMLGLNPITSEVSPLVLDYDAETREMKSDSQYIVFNASMTSVVFDQIVMDPVITIMEEEKEEVVTLPEGIRTTAGEVEAYLYYEHKTLSWPGEIAFDGNTCYLRGASYYLPEAWIKGTLEGNTITFPKNQFFGMASGFKSYAIGCVRDGGSVELDDFRLTWNAEEKCYISDNSMLVSLQPDAFYAMELEEQFRFIGGNGPVDGIKVVTSEDSSSTVYMLDGRRIEKANAHGIFIENGKKVVIK